MIKETTMKYLVLFFMLFSLCQATVYFRKSEFTDNYWQAYIPADNTGEYWLQVGFGTPINDDAYLPYFTMIDMTYGKLCDGEQIPGVGADGLENTSEITGAASWDPYSLNTIGAFPAQLNGDWQQLGENQNPATPLTIDLPDTHNEIHILYNFSSVADPAQLTISWSDDSTTDLEVTELPSDYATDGVREFIVLKGTAVGSRTLKLVSGSGAGYTKLIGIRSWDTNTQGDLSDSDDSLVTLFSQVPTTGDLCIPNPATTLNSTNTIAIGSTTTLGKTWEWGVIWDSGGTTYDASGGNNHMRVAAGNNPYVMEDDKYRTSMQGPAIYVDETLKGMVYSDTGSDDTSVAVANVLTDSTSAWTTDALIGMTVYNRTDGTSGVITDNDGTTVTVASGITWDSGDAYVIGWPRGQIFSGDSITIRSDGILDGQTAGTEPDCEWIFVIDDSGLSVQVTISWNSDIVFQTPPAIYCPELPMNTTYAGLSSFRWYNDATETAIPVGDTSDVTYSSKGSSCDVICSNPKFALKMICFSPASRWVYANLGGNNKFYGGSRGGFAGNTTPAAGDVLVLGGKYEARKLNSNGSEDWQGITGGETGGYRSRY